jgi:asparagine synthase (glutamine-hydrolysing)
MCGFIYTTKPQKVDSIIWNSAQASILCRGPDQQGESLTDFGSFSHSRLSIIGNDLSGRQPLSSFDSKSTLVFNGEIYNYREIATLLDMEAESDTQVLFSILENQRYDLIRNLQGIYSFVFVSPNENRIFALRDQFGVKPLYFSDQDGDLLFASVLAPILLLNSTNQLDLDSIERFLATGSFQSGKTLVKNAKEISPGILYSWELRSKNLVSKERISYRSLSKVVCSKSESLRKAVIANLTSDVPVGLMLSGGVDSTLIASIATKSGAKLDCFTLTNPADSSINESSYARLNSKNLGLNLVEVPLDYSKLEEHMNMILKSSGEPFGDPAYLLLRHLAVEIAKTHKTVLAGEGADELFGGYARYRVHALRGTFLGKILRNLGVGFMIQTPKLDSSRLSRTIFALLVKDDFDAHSSLLGHNWGLAADLMGGIPGVQKNRDREDWAINNPSPLGYPFSRARIYDVENTLIGTYLEKSDRASMSCGLEVRVPFLDQGLLDTLISGNEEEKEKAFLKSELLRFFPNVSLPKRKMGLSVNIRKILEQYDLRYHLSVINQLVLNSRDISGENFEEHIKRLDADPFLAFRLVVLSKTLEIWANNLEVNQTQT